MKSFQIKDLNFSYQIENHKVHILKDFNLDIEKGDMVAIQGPSGSGKSTLLYLMGCMLGGDSGKIQILDNNVTDMNEEQKAFFRNQNLGFVFQQFHLLPKLNVLENVLLPAQISGDTNTNIKNKALSLLDQLGLSERQYHKTHQLSGGQQQRVAIARALINDPDIILADEPTGNLDSKSSSQIMLLLKELNKQGKTVVIITHDSDIAKQCNTIVFFKDGKVESIQKNTLIESSEKEFTIKFSKKMPFSKNGFKISFQSIQESLQNIRQHKVRSFLTMLGITIGIASVLSMISLGEFTKDKILDSYADLGVNTLQIRGSQNYFLKAIDKTTSHFESFDVEKDLTPLKKIFPDVNLISPALETRRITFAFGGSSYDENTSIYGVSEDYLKIVKSPLIIGKDFSWVHIQEKSRVCILGYDVYKKLFSRVDPIGQVLQISEDSSIVNTYACRIIGVLGEVNSNKNSRANGIVYLPYSFFVTATQDRWNSRIAEFIVELKNGADIEKVGNGIQYYFSQKYGKSGRFRVSGDSILLGQMKKFLNLFTLMLSSIAFVSLAVGGVGITNMMLVSVNERLREVGVRRAFGATSEMIKNQFLAESIILCALAGAIGLVLGFASYEAMIYLASKLAEKVPFEWVVNPIAILVALVSTLGVGIISGIYPSQKAEKMEIISALRSE